MPSVKYPWQKESYNNKKNDKPKVEMSEIMTFDSATTLT